MLSIGSRPSRRLLALVPAGALVLGLLAGCGGGDEADSSSDASSSPTPTASSSPSESPKKPKPSPSQAEGTEVDVTIKGDTITPVAEAVEIGVGETVVLHVTSDRAGELHVHSDPEQELGFPAGTKDLEVTIDRPGSVDVEEHESGAVLLRILVR